jgi:hypothetical protein
MSRKQIMIALACAGLIGGSTTWSAGNTAKQNATGTQPVLIARSGQQGSGSHGKARGGNQGKPGGGNQRPSPKGPKPVATA